MENENSLVFDNQPPFELPLGGSFVKNNLSSLQKQYYNDALQYAINKNDSNPEEFAQKVSESVINSNGKNNPFGDLANKYQPGVIKDGVKYRNYSSSMEPISNKYNEYKLDQSNKQLEQSIYNSIATPIQEENIPQEVQNNIPEENINNNFEQTQQPINIPQSNPTSLNQQSDIYSKNYSDIQSQMKNPTSQLESINPIQQTFACGGKMNKYADGGDLNSYNVGGLHETNPLGGIPQGIGLNGKMNTVEQDETSFDIDGQKFIFSNRIKL